MKIHALLDSEMNEKEGIVKYIDNNVQVVSTTA